MHYLLDAISVVDPFPLKAFVVLDTYSWAAYFLKLVAMGKIWIAVLMFNRTHTYDSTVTNQIH